jgi:hypothetical protein
MRLSLKAANRDERRRNPCLRFSGIPTVIHGRKVIPSVRHCSSTKLGMGDLMCLFKTIMVGMAIPDIGAAALLQRRNVDDNTSALRLESAQGGNQRHLDELAECHADRHNGAQHHQQGQGLRHHRRKT